MNILSGTSSFHAVGGQRLHVERFGCPADPAVLLIMGNSAPGLLWPDAFCTALAARGMSVIRFDHRDTGLSSHVDYTAHPYTLEDLAAEALGVLDALDLPAAHVVGMSQGGVVACLLALAAPHRVRSLTLLMSSLDLGPKNDAFAGIPPRQGALPGPAADYVARVVALNAVPARTEAETATRFVENFRLAKGPGSPFDEHAWAVLGQAFAAIPRLRGDGVLAAIANHSNHRRAQMATAPLGPGQLAQITAPALVVHGAGDPIFPLRHAQWAAGCLRDARIRIVPDMGHALDPAFFDPVIDALTGFFGTLQAGDRPPRAALSP